MNTLRLKAVCRTAPSLFLLKYGMSWLLRDVGLLIPSSTRTTSCTSFVVVSLDTTVNNVTITARREDGSTIGTKSLSIAPGARFRSNDLLGELDAGLGELVLSLSNPQAAGFSAVFPRPGRLFPRCECRRCLAAGFHSMSVLGRAANECSRCARDNKRSDTCAACRAGIADVLQGSES